MHAFMISDDNHLLSVIVFTMVEVNIKGTACAWSILYNVAPLSGHSLHKLQAIYSQLGSYTTLRQLYHALAVIPWLGNHSTSQLDYDLVVVY